MHVLEAGISPGILVPAKEVVAVGSAFSTLQAAIFTLAGMFIDSSEGTVEGPGGGG